MRHDETLPAGLARFNLETATQQRREILSSSFGSCLLLRTLKHWTCPLPNLCPPVVFKLRGLFTGTETILPTSASSIAKRAQTDSTPDQEF